MCNRMPASCAARTRLWVSALRCFQSCVPLLRKQAHSSTTILSKCIPHSESTHLSQLTQPLYSSSGRAKVPTSTFSNGKLICKPNGTSTSTESSELPAILTQNLTSNCNPSECTNSILSANLFETYEKIVEAC